LQDLAPSGPLAVTSASISPLSSISANERSAGAKAHGDSRRLVLPKRIDAWSLTSLQQRIVKTGGRLIKHARYYWLQLAESHLTRRLFGSMLHRIAALPSPAG